MLLLTLLYCLCRDRSVLILIYTSFNKFHNKYALRLHNHLRKSLLVSEKILQRCRNIRNPILFWKSLPSAFWKRDKQKADKYLYLSSCFCHHNEKAKQQHSLSKHYLELVKRKVRIQESEWGEYQNNCLKVNSLRHWNEIYCWCFFC